MSQAQEQRDNRVYDAIHALAKAGEPMMRGRDFAAHIGVSSRTTEGCIERLKNMGRIAVEKPAANSRIIHIDGMATAPQPPIVTTRHDPPCPVEASRAYFDAIAAYVRRRGEGMAA